MTNRIARLFAAFDAGLMTEGELSATLAIRTIRNLATQTRLAAL